MREQRDDWEGPWPEIRSCSQTERLNSFHGADQQRRLNVRAEDNIQTECTRLKTTYKLNVRAEETTYRLNVRAEDNIQTEYPSWRAEEDRQTEIFHWVLNTQFSETATPLPQIHSPDNEDVTEAEIVHTAQDRDGWKSAVPHSRPSK